jgi:hypothetical protein
MALTLDGSNGITFPNATVQSAAVANNAAITALVGGRGLSNTIVPAGTVLQCIQYGEYTSGTLTSTSFVQLGSMTLSITPTSSTSKILAIVSLPALYLQFSTGPAHCYSTLYRNGSNLSTGGSFGFSLVSGNTNAGNNWASAAFTYLDSPSTTSAVTYTVYVKNTSGSVGGTILGEGGSRATLTLMEIAA